MTRQELTFIDEKLFIRIYNKGADDVFVADDLYTYIYAYLIEPPAEPKYKPFGSADKAREAIQKHGGWVKDKRSDDINMPTSISLGNSLLIGISGSYPCGELVEE